MFPSSLTLKLESILSPKAKRGRASGHIVNQGVVREGDPKSGGIGIGGNQCSWSRQHAQILCQGVVVLDSVLTVPTEW